jgi:hypothetical protein
VIIPKVLGSKIRNENKEYDPIPSNKICGGIEYLRFFDDPQFSILDHFCSIHGPVPRVFEVFCWTNNPKKEITAKSPLFVSQMKFSVTSFQILHRKCHTVISRF